MSFDPAVAQYSVRQTPLRIDDAPRFPHRGFMVDTSRHWQSIGMLKRLIDSLSYAKLNTLHWHVVDDQSFPLEVRAFPKLQGMGSYSEAEKYTRLDVQVGGRGVAGGRAGGVGGWVYCSAVVLPIACDVRPHRSRHSHRSSPLTGE